MSSQRPPSEEDLAAVSADAEPRSDGISATARQEEAQFALAERRAEQEHERAVRRQRQGRIGDFFGDVENVAAYGLGLIVLLIVLAMIALLFDPSLRGDVLDVLRAILLAALGYLGGRHWGR